MNRRTLSIIAGTLLLTGAGIYSGCQTQRAGKPLNDTIADLTPREQTGQRLYMHTCNQCHPNGGAGVGPSLNTKPLPSFMVKAQIRKGGGAMPAFDEQKVSDKDLTAIVDYMDRIRGGVRPW